MRKMKAACKIIFSSDASYMAEVRDRVRAFLNGSAFPEEDAAKIVMAIDEACTNIIRHAYVGLAKPVRLEMKWLKDRTRFVLRDYGRPFQPPTVETKHINPIRPGGLGVFIIGKVFDRVDYAPQARGTRLTLEKRLPPQAP
jgi:anti-sigma regulatory factor (Ser/Thr protein kinase)